MFSGLIKEVARLISIKRKGDLYSFGIELTRIAKESKVGDSLAINGVCLTVASFKKDLVYFDVMGKTFYNTNLCLLKKGDVVNVEEALRMGEKLGGHFVQGHVDGLVTIKAINKKEDGLEFECSLNETCAPFVVEKGSVALDGISLTVQKVGRTGFSVYVIPHTLEATNLKLRKTGDKLNLELDILAKYSKPHQKPPILTLELLKKYGF